MKKTLILPVIIILVSIAGGGVLWWWNKEDFFKANIMQVVSLTTTIIISVIFVQWLNEKRSKREIIVKIVTDILEKIENDEDTFDRGKHIALVKQRTIANKIKYLVSYSEIWEIKDDLKIIEENFERIKEIFSEHYEKEEAENYRMQMENYKYIINDKCNKIIMLLYSQ